jgi:hypothetical protein
MLPLLEDFTEESRLSQKTELKQLREVDEKVQLFPFF